MTNSLSRRQIILSASAVLPGLSISNLANAQSEYPSKSVRVICPFAAGGLSDVLSRKIALNLSDKLGQTFIVENRIGASGAIGLNVAAKAPPDGYTLSYGSFSTLVLNPILNPAFPFRPETALLPVCFLGAQSFALVVSPSMGVSTLPELLTKLKANPGKYNFGSPGTGLTQHILGELFKKNAGVDITHVPYNSDAQAFQSVVADTVQMAFTNFALYKGLMDRVKLIAIASKERSPQIPNTPTFEEAGVKGIDVKVWHAFFSAAGTPRGPIEKIDKVVQAAFATPDLRAYYELNGLEPVSQPVDQFTKRFYEEIQNWKQIVPGLNLKLT
jgi:tripartite-type tricarboxylate transporter receptor subunit TctC